MFSGMNVKRKTTSSIFLMMPHVCLSVCVCVVLSEKACSRQHCNTCPVTKPDLNSMCLTSRSKAPCWISPHTCCPHFQLQHPSAVSQSWLQICFAEVQRSFFSCELQFMFSLRVFMWFLFLEDARPHFFKPIFLSRELLRETQYIDDYTDSSIYIFWTYCIWSIHPNCAAHPQNKYTWIRVDDDSSPTWWENGSW